MDKDSNNNDDLFNIAFSNAVNGKIDKKKYETESLKAILNIIDYVEALEKSPTRMSKYIVEKLNVLVNSLDSYDGNFKNKVIVGEDIKKIQSNIANYLVRNEKKELSELKKNLKKLNNDNKNIIEQTGNDEEQDRDNYLKISSIINTNQKKLNSIVQDKINKETNLFLKKLKPINLDRLDLQYRVLYSAIEQENEANIYASREKLIETLKLYKRKLNNNYKYVKCLVDIDNVLNKPDPIDYKMNSVKAILRRKENKDFEKYFGESVNSYLELKKRFRDIYEYLDVKRLLLYRKALPRELKEQNETLKKRWSSEVLEANIGLFPTFKKGAPIIWKRITNAISQRKEATTFRKKIDTIKEELKSIGLMLGLPFVAVGKFVLYWLKTIIGLFMGTLILPEGFKLFSKKKKKKDRKEKRKQKKQLKKMRKEEEKKALQELESEKEDATQKRAELIHSYNVGEGRAVDFSQVFNDAYLKEDDKKEENDHKDSDKKELEEFSEMFDTISNDASKNDMILSNNVKVSFDENGNYADRTIDMGNLSISYKVMDQNEQLFRVSIIDKNINIVIVFENDSEGKLWKKDYRMENNGDLRKIGNPLECSSVYSFKTIENNGNNIPFLIDKDGNYISSSIDIEYIEKIKNLTENSVKSAK